MNDICGNCFKTKHGRFCPYCGFDEEKHLEKYPLALHPGAVLDGRYIVGKVLGQGGFGITYMAQEYDTKKIVAIKEYFPETLATRSSHTTVNSFSGEREDSFNYGKICFLQEAETLAQFIGIPAIVRIYSYFEENNTAYFVMEYLEGISLLDYVKNNGGRISWKEMRRIADPIMDALGEVHSKGIVHRDISPDNIFICSDGQVKIIDFGAARYSLGDKSRSLDVLLKHGYAPKEQYARHGRQGPFTDIYALAATMYRCVTGELPPDSLDRADNDTIEPPTGYGVNMSPAEEAAMMQALAVNPADRFSDIAVFKRALDSKLPPPRPSAVVEPEPMAHRPYEPDMMAQRPYEPEKKSNTSFVVTLVICAIIVVGGVIAMIFAFNNGGSKSKSVSQSTSSEEETAEELIAVPDVVGDSETTAVRKIEEAGFVCIVDEASDDTVESGYVISQSIAEGVKRGRGTVITITVSKGAEKTEVPNVVGDTEADAKIKLSDADLTYNVEKEYSDTVSNGTVISQSEYPGTSVNVNTTVTITVSKGVEDKGELTADDDESFRKIYDNMEEYVGYTVTSERIYLDKIAQGEHYDCDALWFGFPPEGGGSFDIYCTYNLDNVTSVNDNAENYFRAKFKIEVRDNKYCMVLSSAERLYE